MDSNTLKKYVLAQDVPENSILLRANHAVGKSSLVTEICKEKKGFMIDMRLGQRDLGDVLGFPYVEDDGTNKHFGHITPDLIAPAFCKDINSLGLIGDANDILTKRNPDGTINWNKTNRKPEDMGQPYSCIFLFLDEMNRATKDVQQSVFELIYDRRMSGKKLNPLCFVFSAINSNLDLYTVTEMDPALMTRFSVIDFKPTAMEWLEWGKSTGQINKEVLFVINMKKELLDPPHNATLDYLANPHENRRSWHAFSQFHTKYKTKFSETEMREIGATFIGRNASEQFTLIVRDMDNLTVKQTKSSATESQISKEFIEGYFASLKWNDDEAANKIKELNPSEMEAVADSCIEYFSKFKYFSNVLLTRMFAMSKFGSKEFFSKIYNSPMMNTDNGSGQTLAEKLDIIAERAGSKDHFKQFKKN